MLVRATDECDASLTGLVEAVGAGGCASVQCA